MREFNSIPFVGGTYLGVNLAEIDANRAKELKLKEDYGVEISARGRKQSGRESGAEAGRRGAGIQRATRGRHGAVRQDGARDSARAAR